MHESGAAEMPLTVLFRLLSIKVDWEKNWQQEQ